MNPEGRCLRIVDTLRWRSVRDELERMQLVTLEPGEGRVAKRSLTTTRQRQIFGALEPPEPPPFSSRAGVREECNTEHLHSSLGYATPVEFAATQPRPAALVPA